MDEKTALWGWLDQGDLDPLAGKKKAEDLIRHLLGLSELRHTPPELFNPAALRRSRLGKAARTALHARFGAAGFSEDSVKRARLSLGQSYPDQLKRRSGIVENPVDAIVSPTSVIDATDLLKLATIHKFSVTAAGGASNVVGAFNVSGDKRPRIVADMTQMGDVIEISGQDHTVSAQAGITLPALETALNARGLTLGHFPQSFHGATLGGSIACNGAGQRSDGYGRLQDNLVRAEIATPSGLWATESFRHAASGPWLGGLVAGSEGLLGLLCNVTMRVHAGPEIVEDRAWYFPDFDSACNAVRHAAQNGHNLSMLRVSDAEETNFLGRFSNAMAGRDNPPFLHRLVLAAKRVPPRPVLLIAGFEGPRSKMKAAFDELGATSSRHGAVSLGRRPGASWRKGRYNLPYLRESLMSRGLGVDTFETALPWHALQDAHVTVKQALKEIIATSRGSLPGNAAVMCHLSHCYPEGACLYFTAIFPRNDDALAQWRVIKAQASETIIRAGGTISHHHGIGADHAEYAGVEKGELGLSLLRAVKLALDPENVMVGGASSLFKQGN